MTRDMSASLKVVRIAAVCWASTRRWAILWRMPLIRCRTSRGRARLGAGATGLGLGLGPGLDGGEAGGAGLADGSLALGSASAGFSAERAATWARMSPLVIRPPRP